MRIVLESITIFCLLLVCVSCGNEAQTKTAKELIVKVAEVKSDDTPQYKEFPFIAKPHRTSELSFRVGGPIDRFDVYPGNYYKRGDIIAEIDPRDFRIRKESASAVYSQAKTEFERIEILYNKKNISASAYERAKADYTSAKSAFDTATNELEDTRLIAPFDGYVGEVYIEKFQDVKATQAVISFVEISQLKIEAYVTQDIAFNSDAIRSVNLHFDASPEQSYTARVIEVSKSTTKNNLSYLLTALLPNEDGKLLSGMSGKIVFESTPKESSPAITVPQIALCHTADDGDYVWVVDPTTEEVTKRNVTINTLRRGGTIHIADGVQAGETIAVSGLRFLSNGMKIKIAGL